LGPYEAAVDKALVQIEIGLVPQLPRQGLERLLQHAGLDPVLEPSVAGLVRRVSIGQILPAGAGAQNPQHAIHDRPRLGQRPAFAAPLRRLGKQRLDQLPLRIRQLVPSRHA